MTNTVPSSEARAIRPNLRPYELEVSPYERVASMLLALLVLVGISVLTMLILWLSSQIFGGQVAVPVVLEEIGTGEGPLGGMQLDAPMADELGQETDLEEPAVENTLAAIADAVASQQALLDNPALTEETLPGRGGSTGDGRGIGFGSGPGGTGRARRWIVHFPEGNTTDTYARQLEHFKIELGVLDPATNQIIYVYNLTKPQPDVRTGKPEEEQRYYLTWRSGGLEQADRALLGRAGVDTRGRLMIVKFIPRELEAELIRQERTRAGNEATNIRATYYGILPDRGGYRFYVTDQTYR